MARRVHDTNLATREARRKLKARHKPYWRLLEGGRHLGYYKGARGGRWVARYFLGAGKYAEKTIGLADDFADADGVGVFSFAQAQDEARRWFVEQARIAAGLEPKPTAPYTVSQALDDYLNAYKVGLTKGGGRATYDTTRLIDAHIRPALSSVRCDRLTTARINAWLRGVATAPARLRTRRGKVQKHRPAPETPDAARARRATANRVLNVLKAALNHAWNEKQVDSDEAWRPVKSFHNVDAPVDRYLTRPECARLVYACDEAFRPLVRAALLTGCRYGELVALKVADLDVDANTVHVRAPKSGKPRHVVLNDEAVLFFGQVTAGKASNAYIFTRPDDRPWGKSHQQRPLAEACRRAKIAPPVRFHDLRRTHGALLAMAGTPMSVIAQQLGHTDERITKRHYAHLAPNYVAQTIRERFPALGIVDKGNVAPMQPSQQAKAGA